MPPPFPNPPMDVGIRNPQMNEGADLLGNFAGNDSGPLAKLAQLMVRLREPLGTAMMGLGGGNASGAIAPLYAPIRTGAMSQPEGFMTPLMSNLRASGVRPPGSPQKDAMLGDIKTSMSRLLRGTPHPGEPDPETIRELQQLGQRTDHHAGSGQLWWSNPSVQAADAMAEQVGRYQDFVKQPKLPMIDDTTGRLGPNMTFKTYANGTNDYPMLQLKSEQWMPKGKTSTYQDWDWNRLEKYLRKLRPQGLWP